MAKKKHIPGEELFKDEEPVVPIVEETPEEVSTDVVAPPIETPAPMEVKLDVCSNCGLPRNDFYRLFSQLRADLQGQNRRVLCPRCFKPVEPY